jgi:FKBP-type peptidyl-prolyl cis-trans isomerase
MEPKQVSDGLRKQVLKAGSGQRVVAGNTITVNCTGSVDVNPPKKFWR